MKKSGHQLNKNESDTINSILDQEEMNLDNFQNTSATLSVLDEQCRQIWPNWRANASPTKNETNVAAFSPRNQQESKYTTSPKDFSIEEKPLKRPSYSSSRSSVHNYEASSVNARNYDDFPNDFSQKSVPNYDSQKGFQATPRETNRQTQQYEQYNSSPSYEPQRFESTKSFKNEKPAPDTKMENFDIQGMKSDIDSLYARINSLSSRSPSSSPGLSPPKTAQLNENQEQNRNNSFRQKYSSNSSSYQRQTCDPMDFDDRKQSNYQTNYAIDEPLKFDFEERTENSPRMNYNALNRKQANDPMRFKFDEVGESNSINKRQTAKQSKFDFDERKEYSPLNKIQPNNPMEFNFDESNSQMDYSPLNKRQTAKSNKFDFEERKEKSPRMDYNSLNDNQTGFKFEERRESIPQMNYNSSRNKQKVSPMKFDFDERAEYSPSNRRQLNEPMKFDFEEKREYSPSNRRQSNEPMKFDDMDIRQKYSKSPSLQNNSLSMPSSTYDFEDTTTQSIVDDDISCDISGFGNYAPKETQNYSSFTKSSISPKISANSNAEGSAKQKRISFDFNSQSKSNISADGMNSSFNFSVEENEELIKLKTENFFMKSELLKANKRIQIVQLENDKLSEALEKSAKLIENYKRQLQQYKKK